VDDESAFDTSNDNTLNAEMKALADREAQIILEESERAQAEQLRLLEVQRIEQESRRYKEEQRRQQAQNFNQRVMIDFQGIMINKIIFEDDEEEDLTLFPDEPYLPVDVRQVYHECGGNLEKIFARLSLSSNRTDEEEDDDENDENNNNEDRQPETEENGDNEGEGDEDDDNTGEEDREGEGTG
jgi:hypothetical protein